MTFPEVGKMIIMVENLNIFDHFSLKMMSFWLVVENLFCCKIV